MTGEVSAVPGRSHITHNIHTQFRHTLVQVEPHGGWTPGQSIAVIYCTDCPLYVEQPVGQADVGAAVARWNAQES